MPQNTTEEDSTGYSPKADGGSVQRLFSHIAGGYDLLNKILSFGFDALWRAKLADAVRPFPLKSTSRILDLAAGTLEVSLALAKRYPNRSILAMDFCRPMLVRGVPKLAKSRNRKIYPVTADARHLPLPDASVDAVTIAFGLRNIRPREEAYAEALRVLTPGGKLCVLEFGSAQDRILFGTYNFYLQHLLPKIGRLFSRDKAAYAYLAETVILYPGADALSSEMQTAGFSQVRYTKHTGGIVVLHIGEKPSDSLSPEALDKTHV
ncbi:ubiquinone/menaquinone biosynthesis methyltransferase [Desulfovibrio sp. OttesenSCG-928-G15]|nr:ubiquinone/menaquinone biosynthesis methyltransferase [Desulfovibrio sp. OttesenSCG-928-G15]